MENVKRMQEISEELIKFSNLFEKHTNSTYSLTGTDFRTLYNVSDCEISIGKITQRIEPHTHEETEHYICVKGSLTVYINGQETKKLKTNDHCIIPPQTVHSLETDGCELLVVRIPSSGLMND